jgi:hypothetical protein
MGTGTVMFDLKKSGDRTVLFGEFEFEFRLEMKEISEIVIVGISVAGTNLLATKGADDFFTQKYRQPHFFPVPVNEGN